MTRLVTTALWVALASQALLLSRFACGFAQIHLKSVLSSSSSSSSIRASSSSGPIKKRSQRMKKEKVTLYDYLGANQKDTQEELKIRYTKLAKILHPDSRNSNRVDLSDYYDLSEINMAWEILKDEKERRRYDRSLQAKEITEGIEEIVAFGIKTAIPWLKKTADTTAAAVDVSTKAAQAGAEQAKTAYGAFGMEQERKSYEQKSKIEDSKASEIEKELRMLSNKKFACLKKKRREQLSSTEVRSILKTFQLVDDPAKVPPSLVSDINLLDDAENKYLDATKNEQKTEQSTKTAIRKVEQALIAEETARKRLEEAQRILKETKQNYAAALNEEKIAKSDERLARNLVMNYAAALKKARENVRVGMVKQQDQFLGRKSEELKLGIEEYKQSSRKFRSEAEKLRIRLKAMEEQ